MHMAKMGKWPGNSMETPWKLAPGRGEVSYGNSMETFTSVFGLEPGAEGVASGNLPGNSEYAPRELPNPPP